MKNTTVLIVLDGFGLAEASEGNAISKANTKNYDEILKNYPSTTLKASGEAVGLFAGQMGNSEVGHLNLGAGRVVKQASKQISDQINSGEFFENEVLLKAVKNKNDLHLMGLLSDGGVHSSMSHLYALLELAGRHNKQNIYLHLFTDGRDSGVTDSLKFVKELSAKINEVGVGKIASVSGRYYAMDRDNNFERIKPAYEALVLGKSETTANGVEEALKESHKNGVTDEFVLPTVF